MASEAVRRAHARLAANTRWSREDTVAGTAPARKGFLAKLAREIDPDGVLTEAELAVRVERARLAHMQRMTIASAAARARRAAA
jgi:hypothetical protein